MFYYLVGSTEMAMSTDPEDMRGVITVFQNIASGVIKRQKRGTWQ